MHIIVYMSRFAHALSDDELLALAQSAAVKNQRLGVTGVLLHDQQRIMQALEGDERVVRELMNTIALDRRHYQLSYLYRGDVSKRQFGGWFMRAGRLDQQHDPARSKVQMADFLVAATEAPVRAALFGFAATARYVD